MSLRADLIKKNMYRQRPGHNISREMRLTETVSLLAIMQATTFPWACKEKAPWFKFSPCCFSQRDTPPISHPWIISQYHQICLSKFRLSRARSHLDLSGLERQRTVIRRRKQGGIEAGSAESESKGSWKPDTFEYVPAAQFVQVDSLANPAEVRENKI